MAVFTRSVLKATVGERPPQSEKKLRGRAMPAKAIMVLCMLSFFFGLLFSGSMWVTPLQKKEEAANALIDPKLPLITHVYTCVFSYMDIYILFIHVNTPSIYMSLFCFRGLVAVGDQYYNIYKYMYNLCLIQSRFGEGD